MDEESNMGHIIDQYGPYYRPIWAILGAPLGPPMGGRAAEGGLPSNGVIDEVASLVDEWGWG